MNQLALGLLSAALRPGGGDSYSGGGGHGGGGGYDSGGGGGGGDSDSAVIGELIFQLIRLCVYYPKIGLPLVALIIGFCIYGYYQKQKNKDWDSGPPVELERSRSLDDLRRIDPDFSQVLFEDFVFRLYATAHLSRGLGILDRLAPYISADARAALAGRSPPGTPVENVVIGAMRTFRVDLPPPEAITADPDVPATVAIELEANYTTGAPSERTTWYVVENWTLARHHAARTRPPKDRNFPCPNCGAPWQGADSGSTQRCQYCGEVVDNGRFDWQLVGVWVKHERAQPPTLTNEVPERGNELATYLAPNLDAMWMGLLRDDPQLSDASLIARLHHIYRLLNDSWTAGDLLPARGVLSDGLYDYLTYWMVAYKQQGLRNVLEGMELTHQQPAKVVRDRWYDAITIRIWGTGLDYVVRVPGGEHVRGSRSRPRPYSEYWTLIRSAARRGPTLNDPRCGNCGAPLIVTQAGGCASCGAHVTAGEFDWVLSKIEQDDSYRG